MATNFKTSPLFCEEHGVVYYTSKDTESVPHKGFIKCRYSWEKDGIKGTRTIFIFADTGRDAARSLDLLCSRWSHSGWTYKRLNNEVS